MRDNLQKLEDYITKHGSESSPFALGTENPTQLDIHIYAGLSRALFAKDSPYHDLYASVHYDRFPRVLKLAEGIQARPEFEGVIATHKQFIGYCRKQAEAPVGVKVQLYLPVDE